MPEREIIVVSNRLPLGQPISGEDRASQASPGGLVSALSPIARSAQLLWAGHGDAHSSEPFEVDGLRLAPIDIEPALFDGYYRGFANQILWPLFHGLPEYVAERPTEAGEDRWWRAYREVNRLFASWIAAHAAPDALIWVQDYHLMLLPRLLRELRPDLEVALFLHIPFPEAESLVPYAWGSELVSGLCDARFIGTQREIDAKRLQEAADLFAAGRRDAVSVVAIPISIDPAPYVGFASAALADGAPAGLRERYGASDRKMLLSVDRLDYTKGILERLDAFAALLETWDSEEPPPVLVQILSPSRTGIPAYRHYDERVRAVTEQLNTRFDREGHRPVVTVDTPLSTEELVQHFLAADVMCVTPLRDGMNLVAKEFLASRVDEHGVLVLGREAGAADELTEAIIVDPSRPEHLTAAMRDALSTPAGEARRALEMLRARVLAHDVYAWARDFLAAVGGEARD